MFETERDLRKVMRLAFFLSKMKLEQAKKTQQTSKQSSLLQIEKRLASEGFKLPSKIASDITNADLSPFIDDSPAVLSNDFFEYKKRILKESQKSFDSTSADSRLRKSETRSDKDQNGPNEEEEAIQLSKQDTIENN